MLVGDASNLRLLLATVTLMSARSNSFLSTSISTGLGATKRFVSIRWSLPLCVITPLVSGILLTSWLAYRTSQKAVDELVGKISKEVAANIEKQVDSYLTKPSLISTVIEAEVTSGNLKIQDTRELAKSLLKLTQTKGLTNNLYYGNEAGEFVYSERQNDISRIDFVDKETDFRRIAYQTEDVTDLSQQMRESDYDPRIRTWYKEAAFNKAPIWSQVYIANSRDALTLTRATPIF